MQPHSRRRFRRPQGRVSESRVTSRAAAARPAPFEAVVQCSIIRGRKLSTLKNRSGSWDGEERFRLLFDLIPDVLWALDLETRKFTYFSPSVEQLLDYTVEEGRAVTLDDILTAESRELISKALPARLEAFLAGNSAVIDHITELEQIRKDGSTMWAELKTRFIHNDDGGVSVIGVSRDITKRKQAEEALHRTALQLNAVLSNAPITIFATYGHGVFTLSEGKGLELVGLKPGENVGVSALDLYGSIPFVESTGKVTTGNDVIR